MNDKAQVLYDLDYRVPYCEACWQRGFASVARVVVGTGDQRRSLCLQCHGDYEKAQEEGRGMNDQQLFESNQWQEIRCPRCHRLLCRMGDDGDGDGEIIEIDCGRCKNVWRVTMQKDGTNFVLIGRRKPREVHG